MEQAILNKARLDKFRLVFDIPRALKGTPDFYSLFQKTIKSDNIQFTIYGSPVPSISVPPITTGYAGQGAYVSSHSRPPYPPLNLTYVIDNGYINYWVMWNWLNKFNDSKRGDSELHTVTPNDVGDPIVNNPLSLLLVDLNLFTLDEYNNNIMLFTYKNAFVTSLGEINYNTRSPDEITSTAQFVYQQMHVKMVKDVNSITGC